MDITDEANYRMSNIFKLAHNSYQNVHQPTKKGAIKKAAKRDHTIYRTTGNHPKYPISEIGTDKPN